MKKSNPDKDLSKRERQLLDALYRLGKASAAEIRESVEDPPTYTAVRTHLTNLETKGFVRYENDGTRYIYEPVVPKEEMAELAVRGLMETFFDNRVDLIVSTLLSRRDRTLSEAEIEKLSAMIEEAKREGR